MMAVETLSEIRVKPIKINRNKTFSAIILNKLGSSDKLLGREPKFWVKFACGEVPSRVVEYDGKTPVLDEAKKYVNLNTDYTFILLSTTPLLEQKDIMGLKDYAIFKSIGICKLPVGYIVNNRYFLDAKSYSVDSVYTGDIDNFYIVENKKQYKYALSVLQDRINTFHMENGVEILKPSSVYIEPEVDILSGVTLHPNVSLKGETTIGENTIIKDGAVIDGSEVGKNVFIGSSRISKSKIGDNVCIASFCEIENSKVGEGATIDSLSIIHNYKVKKHEKIKSNSVLGDSNDSSSGAR